MRLSAVCTFEVRFPRSHFTGKERDAESGNDYFEARYYESSMGRFLSPDPVIITPDRMRDPQQFNLYAYVRNSPLRLVDPTGEILECTGNAIEQASCFSQLQEVAGELSNRLSMNAIGVISFDTTGLDLSSNEGASLLNQVVGSSSLYGLALSTTESTAGGPHTLTGATSNNDTLYDPRYGNGKGPKDLPPAGVDDQITVDPNARYLDSKNQPVSVSALVFHELAEAYAKIDEGKPYSDFPSLNVRDGMVEVGPMQQGAHNEAGTRQLKAQGQHSTSPSLRTSGNAADHLIRNPR
jgi:RHS repeat-associated protein